MILVVTPLYAGLLGLLFTFLSLRVIRTRRRCHVPLGDGGEKALLRCLRVQANFAEYVPFCLLLMTLAELQGLPGWLLHSMGLALLTGRLAHAVGVSRDPEPFQFRVAGMSLTFGVLCAAAVLNLLLALGLA